MMNEDRRGDKGRRKIRKKRTRQVETGKQENEKGERR